MRGLAPATSAAASGLEDLAAMRVEKLEPFDGGSIAPIETGICMALWMLRGIEAASSLAEQTVADIGVVAYLNLWPAKMEPTGSQGPRRLLCSCTSSASAATCSAPVGSLCSLCPVLALARAQPAAVGARVYYY